MPYCVDAIRDITSGGMNAVCDVKGNILDQFCRIYVQSSPSVPRWDNMLTTTAVCHKPAEGKDLMQLIHEMYAQLQNVTTEHKIAAPEMPRVTSDAGSKASETTS
jgi:hypothetical protein